MTKTGELLREEELLLPRPRGMCVSRVAVQQERAHRCRQRHGRELEFSPRAQALTRWECVHGAGLVDEALLEFVEESACSGIQR